MGADCGRSDSCGRPCAGDDTAEYKDNEHYILTTKRLQLDSVVLNVFSFLVHCLQMLYVYSSELYPTESRACGLAICEFFGHLGAFLAAYVVDVFVSYKQMYIII